MLCLEVQEGRIIAEEVRSSQSQQWRFDSSTVAHYVNHEFFIVDYEHRWGVDFFYFDFLVEHLLGFESFVVVHVHSCDRHEYQMGARC
eukprot:s114_g19.t1